MRLIGNKPWAFYNEIDSFAAACLRELIKAGHIAPGEVDERSIEDVVPTDLMGFTQCHFFAGIGVWSYALRRAGWPDDRPVWTGSCPCQPFSAAGKGKGFADERHLWPAFFHCISECRPVTIFGEQVGSKDGLTWLDLVQTDLEGTGYAVGTTNTPAAGFGAPHIRQRLYWVAHNSPVLGEEVHSGSRGFQFLEPMEMDGERQGLPLSQYPAGKSLDAQTYCQCKAGRDCRPYQQEPLGQSKKQSANSHVFPEQSQSTTQLRRGGKAQGPESLGCASLDRQEISVARIIQDERGSDSGKVGSLEVCRITNRLADAESWRQPGGVWERGQAERSTGEAGRYGSFGRLGDTSAPGLQVCERVAVGGEGRREEGGTTEQPGCTPCGLDNTLCNGCGTRRHHDGEYDRQQPCATLHAGGLGHAKHGRREVGVEERPGASSALPPGAPYELDNRGRPGPTNGFWRASDWLFCRDGRWRPTQSLAEPLADGLADRLGYRRIGSRWALDPLKEAAGNRVGRLRGYGNAINAIQAEEFIRAYMAAEQETRDRVRAI